MSTTLERVRRAIDQNGAVILGKNYIPRSIRSQAGGPMVDDVPEDVVTFDGGGGMSVTVTVDEAERRQIQQWLDERKKRQS